MCFCCHVSHGPGLCLASNVGQETLDCVDHWIWAWFFSCLVALSTTLPKFMPVLNIVLGWWVLQWETSSNCSQDAYIAKCMSMCLQPTAAEPCACVSFRCAMRLELSSQQHLKGEFHAHAHVHTKALTCCSMFIKCGAWMPVEENDHLDKSLQNDVDWAHVHALQPAGNLITESDDASSVNIHNEIVHIISCYLLTHLLQL